MTSNTATHAPALAFLSAFTDSSRPTGAAEMLALLDTIRSGNRHGLLQASPAIPNASLQLAKATLDAYAAQVSDEQQERLREANKKRKRQGAGSAADVLKIRKLHVDGFESGQVWQQARRIINSTLQDSKDILQDLEESNKVGTNGETKALEFDEDGFEIDSEEEESELSEDPEDEGADSEVSDEDDLEEGLEAEDDVDMDETSEVNGLHDDEDLSDEPEDEEDDEEDEAVEADEDDVGGG